MSNQIDFFYHVTMDLNIEEKEFTPRIPKYRCKNEDSTTPRVCACTTLKDAIGAFPYKCLYVNQHMSYRDESYLVFYKIPNKNLKYKTNEEINSLVPDAHITKEHWILNSFKAKPTMIKIKNITLSNYNKYIDEYSGFVKELEYEKSEEDYDRTAEYTFVDKQFFKEAINFAKENNISYEILEDTYHHLWHRRYFISSINYNGTTKRYHLLKIKFYIPKGTDISQLWLINDKHNDFLKRKNISAMPFDISEERRSEIIDCLMNYPI